MSHEYEYPRNSQNLGRKAGVFLVILAIVTLLGTVFWVMSRSGIATVRVQTNIGAEEGTSKVEWLVRITPYTNKDGVAGTRCDFLIKNIYNGQLAFIGMHVEAHNADNVIVTEAAPATLHFRKGATWPFTLECPGATKVEVLQIASVPE